MANGKNRFVEATADGEARQVSQIVNRSIVSGNSLTGKCDISGDLARGDRALENSIGGLDCKIAGSNNRRMQTVFSVASHGFENQPEKDLTDGGQKEKANATQDDEQAGKLFVAVKEHGDERCGLWFACQFRGCGGGKLSVRRSVDRSVSAKTSTESFLFRDQWANLQGEILLLGMEEGQELFPAAVRAGATGYLLKDASAGDVIAAVRPSRAEKRRALRSSVWA